MTSKVNKDLLLKNLDKLHTTLLGVLCIRRNLNIENEDVVEYCKKRISHNEALIYHKGKNWYCEIDNIRITINSYSFTIITTHKMGIKL